MNAYSTDKRTNLFSKPDALAALVTSLQTKPANGLAKGIDIRLEKIFDEPLPLSQLRTIAALKEMELLRKGSRLSVQPVRKAEFEAIMKLAK